ncbi:Ribokinase-like protein [Multifurca ochricompacta]|uniref:ATP-dependent (S)-NAD(P)H-hydrate dehydratase n=1 Tax=Multifurca ochricompacta TaxID=376703 RepID=A0AAD4MB16_9AGAM|nr:Ribokinase-like protein [Multifurca ochricompacta]
MPVPKAVFEQIRQIIPPLNGTLRKGQSGRVGVLGGALDYTGAPFFAAISAQRVGVDLSHVICSPTAANAIKSYSPDLIVHPILREETPPEALRGELAALLSRLHVLVIGPGLGREKYMQTFARLALGIAKEQGMFLVLDADGLYVVGGQLDLIRGYRRAVLTPNVVEFERLSEQAGIDPDTPPEERASSVSKVLGGVTILQKGQSDIIATNTEGANSRAAHEASKISPDEALWGQGDILSGSVGAFLAWAKCYESGAFGDSSISVSRMPILAAIGASMVTRTTSRRGFEKEGRGVVTQDMLKEIGGAFAEIFGGETQGGGKL